MFAQDLKNNQFLRNLTKKLGLFYPF